MVTDYELMQGIKDDDSTHYKELVKRYTAYVIAVVMKISGSRLTNEDREEIVADIFVKIWESRHKLNIAEGKEKAYIGQMARHRTISVLNKRGLLVVIPLEENRIQESSDNLEIQIVQQEEKQLIKEAIDALGEPDREIFIRRYFYFDKVVEIAHGLGIKEQTVATKLYRGRDKLRQYLIERGLVR